MVQPNPIRQLQEAGEISPGAAPYGAGIPSSELATRVAELEGLMGLLGEKGLLQDVKELKEGSADSELALSNAQLIAAIDDRLTASITDHGAERGENCTAAVQQAVHYLEQVYPAVVVAGAPGEGQLQRLSDASYRLGLAEGKLGDRIKEILEADDADGSSITLRVSSSQFLIGTIGVVSVDDRVASLTVVISEQAGASIATGDEVAVLVGDPPAAAVFFPPGEWLVRDTIVMHYGTALLGVGTASRVVFAGAPDGRLAFDWQGDVLGPYDLVNSGEKGDPHVHLSTANASGFSAGDLIKVWSDTHWLSPKGEKDIGEMNQVTEVSDGEIRLRDRLREDYLLSENARAYRIVRPIHGVTITALRLEGGSSDTSLHQLARITWGDTLTVKNLQVVSFRGMGAIFNDCVNIDCRGITIEKCDGLGQGYVFTFGGGSNDFQILNCHLRDCNHAADLVGDLARPGKTTDGATDNNSIRGRYITGFVGLVDDGRRISAGDNLVPIIPSGVGFLTVSDQRDIPNQGTVFEFEVEAGQVWELYMLLYHYYRITPYDPDDSQRQGGTFDQRLEMTRPAGTTITLLRRRRAWHLGDGGNTRSSISFGTAGPTIVTDSFGVIDGGSASPYTYAPSVGYMILELEGTIIVTNTGTFRFTVTARWIARTRSTRLLAGSFLDRSIVGSV